MRVSGALGGIAGIAAALAVLALAPRGAADPPKDDAYALDPIVRELKGRGEFACPKLEMVTYKGTALKYDPPAQVYVGFRDRLEKFERVAEQVGREVYGRPPRSVVNLGAYACRRMTSYSGWLSEHALGNAIDVAGFDFGALPKDAALPAGLDKVFKNGFEVRVLGHWSSKTGYAAVHARFLRTLAQRLIDRKDVFRVLLGPSYPGHKNHFHFDVSPFRLVDIFDADEAKP